MLNTPSISTAHPDSQFLVAQARPDRRELRAAVILVATDGTERADGALRVALARAVATGATLEEIGRAHV